MGEGIVHVSSIKELELRCLPCNSRDLSIRWYEEISTLIIVYQLKCNKCHERLSEWRVPLELIQNDGPNMLQQIAVQHIEMYRESLMESAVTPHIDDEPIPESEYEAVFMSNPVMTGTAITNTPIIKVDESLLPEHKEIQKSVIEAWKSNEDAGIVLPEGVSVEFLNSESVNNVTLQEDEEPQLHKLAREIYANSGGQNPRWVLMKFVEALHEAYNLVKNDKEYTIPKMGTNTTYLSDVPGEKWIFCQRCKSYDTDFIENENVYNFMTKFVIMCNECDHIIKKWEISTEMLESNSLLYKDKEIHKQLVELKKELKALKDSNDIVDALEF